MIIVNNNKIQCARLWTTSFCCNILTGAAITEVIFGRPGLGSFLATAITNKNIPVVQGAVVVIGIAYVIINLIIDLIVGAVDPRTRSAGLA